MTFTSNRYSDRALTGKVKFNDETLEIGSATLNSGVARLVTRHRQHKNSNANEEEAEISKRVQECLDFLTTGVNISLVRSAADK